jgi:hypothetical protein
MRLLDAVEAVLTQVGTSLHYREISQRMLDGGFWQTTGCTPHQTVNGRLAVDILEKGQIVIADWQKCGAYGNLCGSDCGFNDTSCPLPCPIGSGFWQACCCQG